MIAKSRNALAPRDWHVRILPVEPIKRFWQHVEIQKNGCWNFDILYSHGYGYIGINKNKRMRAHRFSYEHFIGKIPKGMTIDHLCNNKACVNPNHLEVVTQKENGRRAPNSVSTINSKKTHCPKGHPYKGDNLQIHGKSPRRVCAKCKRIKENTRYALLHPKKNLANQIASESSEEKK